MFYRFSATLLMWMALVLSITSLAAVYSSFPGDESSELFNSVSQLLDAPTRSKRMGPISCRCCSNAFNSHCCLKCMQRLGKRQASSLPSSQTAFVSLPPASEDMGVDYPVLLASEWPLLGRACTCCLYQRTITPFGQVSACCEHCRTLAY